LARQTKFKTVISLMGWFCIGLYTHFNTCLDIIFPRKSVSAFLILC